MRPVPALPLAALIWPARFFPALGMLAWLALGRKARSLAPPHRSGRRFIRADPSVAGARSLAPRHESKKATACQTAAGVLRVRASLAGTAFIYHRDMVDTVVALLRETYDACCAKARLPPPAYAEHPARAHALRHTLPAPAPRLCHQPHARTLG